MVAIKGGKKCNVCGTNHLIDIYNKCSWALLCCLTAMAVVHTVKANPSLGNRPLVCASDAGGSGANAAGG